MRGVFPSVFTICSAVIIGLVIVLSFQRCDAIDAKRDACVRAGHPANDCRALFNFNGTDR